MAVGVRTGIRSRRSAGGGGAAPAFDPSQLADLRWWVSDSSGVDFYTDGTETTPATDGAGFGRWKATTPTTVNFTNTLLSGPTLNVNAVASKSVAACLSGSQSLTTTSTLSGAAFYAAIVLRMSSVVSNGNFEIPFSASPASGNDYFYLRARWDSTGGNNVITRFGDGGTGGSGFIDIAGDVGAGYNLYEMAYDGSAIRLRVNKGSWSTSNGPGYTLTRFALGAVFRDAPGSYTTNAYIAEGLCVNAWNSGNADSVADYLKTRFGIA